jgi:hypothetical protein
MNLSTLNIILLSGENSVWTVCARQLSSWSHGPTFHLPSSSGRFITDVRDRNIALSVLSRTHSPKRHRRCPPRVEATPACLSWGGVFCRGRGSGAHRLRLNAQISPARLVRIPGIVGISSSITCCDIERLRFTPATLQRVESAQRYAGVTTRSPGRHSTVRGPEARRMRTLTLVRGMS